MINYWKNVSVVFYGASLAQIIPIIGTLFITRIYTPDDYGEYSLWLAVVLVLAVVLTLRYEAALALEADGAERSSAVLAILIIIGFLGFSTTITLTIISFILPDFVDRFSYLAIISLVPAGMLLAFNVVLQAWAAADGRYHQLNIIRLAFAGLVTTFQVLGGLFYASNLTLIFMHILGLLISFLFSYWLNSIKIDCVFSLRLSIKSFLIRRKRFPIYSLPSDLVSTVSAQLPLIVITTRFGSEVGGVFALTMKMLGAPLGVIGKAVLDVFKRYAAIEVNETGSCKNIYLKTLKLLFLLSLIIVACVLFFAEWFFLLAFGGDWIDAGKYAIWLLPLFAMRFIASPLSYTIYIKENQHFDLLWQMIFLSVTFFSLLLNAHINSTLILYGLSCSFMYAIYLYITFKLC
ncbi:lipopolysaccharide biosynthesis protein [Marinobacterium stanieri]|uniref:lipopolysaccharide biosynthesis protein n=1 Tax=Marinobacterium stanieri TaxID=49186 RepID=UPI00025592AB|nr:oligosaccharide flippase family protein [Marinobacterium stanieri]